MPQVLVHIHNTSSLELIHSCSTIPDNRHKFLVTVLFYVQTLTLLFPSVFAPRTTKYIILHEYGPSIFLQY